MSERWALRLTRNAAGILAGLRLTPGVQVCERGSEVWLRGERADDALRRQLLALPESSLFEVLDDGALVPHGARVPVEALAEGPWQSLPSWLKVTLETAALPGRIGERAGLRIVPSTEEREANVLLTSLEAWTAYAVDAPQVRLQRWRFAVRAGGETAIRGTPLPPLPGRVYCESDGVAVQAGWTWAPCVEAKVLRKVLGLAKGDLALLHADGTWERILAGGFVAATRSAVRLTVGGPDNGP